MLLLCAIFTSLTISFFPFYIVFDLAISHPLQGKSRLCRNMDAKMEERRHSTAWWWWAGRTWQIIMRSYSKRARMKFSPKYVWTTIVLSAVFTDHEKKKSRPSEFVVRCTKLCGGMRSNSSDFSSVGINQERNCIVSSLLLVGHIIIYLNLAIVVIALLYILFRRRIVREQRASVRPAAKWNGLKKSQIFSRFSFFFEWFEWHDGYIWWISNDFHNYCFRISSTSNK